MIRFLPFTRVGLLLGAITLVLSESVSAQAPETTTKGQPIETVVSGLPQPHVTTGVTSSKPDLAIQGGTPSTPAPTPPPSEPHPDAQPDATGEEQEDVATDTTTPQEPETPEPLINPLGNPSVDILTDEQNGTTSAYPAPIIGLPVPMDGKFREWCSMTAVDIKLVLRQHEARLVIMCALESSRADTLALGLPIKYMPIDERKNAVDADPMRCLPVNQVIADLEVTCNGFSVPLGTKSNQLQLAYGKHAQAHTESFAYVRGATLWASFSPKLNEGVNVVTFSCTIPYSQSTTTGEASMTINSPYFVLDASTARAWNTPMQRAEVLVFCEEMLPQNIKFVAPLSPRRHSQSTRGVLTTNLLDSKGTPNGCIIRAGQAVSVTAGPTFSIEKQSASMIPYTIVASSTQQIDPFGNPSSAENLKGPAGYWGGQREDDTLTIALPKPTVLQGILIQSGVSPLVSPNDDAKRTPNLSFSLFPRPHTLQITLNNEYTFKATLADDWAYQLVIPPTYKKPVQNINIKVHSIYPGTIHPPIPGSFMSSILILGN